MKCTSIKHTIIIIHCTILHTNISDISSNVNFLFFMKFSPFLFFESDKQTKQNLNIIEKTINIGNPINLFGIMKFKKIPNVINIPKNSIHCSFLSI